MSRVQMEGSEKIGPADLRKLLKPQVEIVCLQRIYYLEDRVEFLKKACAAHYSEKKALVDRLDEIHRIANHGERKGGIMPSFKATKSMEHELDLKECSKANRFYHD